MFVVYNHSSAEVNPTECLETDRMSGCRQRIGGLFVLQRSVISGSMRETDQQVLPAILSRTESRTSVKHAAFQTEVRFGMQDVHGSVG